MICRNISVETSGYLDMRSNNDLRTAKFIDFSKDEGLDKFRRSYRNKDVMRIRLPDTDAWTRFTFCIILSEICRTLFPSAWQYIAVTAGRPSDLDGMLRYALYSVDGDYNEECIYIFEDSDVDLGLIGAIERNWNRIMEMMTDYLNWHFEKMRERPSTDPVPRSPIAAGAQAQEEKETAEEIEEKNKRAIEKLWERLRKLLGEKEKAGTPAEKSEELDEEKAAAAEVPEPAVTESTQSGNGEAESTESGDAEAESTEPESAEAEAAESAGAEAESEKAEEKEESSESEGTEKDNEAEKEEASGASEDTETAGLPAAKPTRYQRECYLKYGFDKIDSRLHIDEVRKFLTARGWSDNALRRARKAADPEEALIELEGIGHCDFCGKTLTGVSYERLSDGRIRCDECSSTAITSESEFRDLFLKVLRSMEGFYGIDYRRPITAWMTDSKTLARSSGRIFSPTDGFDSRSLGYAVKKNDGSVGIVVENGSPRLASIATLAHELTHIWQYINWDDNQMKRLYPDDFTRLAVYEGMAKWAEIQYLYIIGETTYARQQEYFECQRKDEYGLGLRSYIDRYPLMRDGSLVKNSPFKVFPPL